jgi:hypothetical protein
MKVHALFRPHPGVVFADSDVAKKNAFAVECEAQVFKRFVCNEAIAGKLKMVATCLFGLKLEFDFPDFVRDEGFDLPQSGWVNDADPVVAVPAMDAAQSVDLGDAATCGGPAVVMLAWCIGGSWQRTPLSVGKPNPNRRWRHCAGGREKGDRYFLELA